MLTAASGSGTNFAAARISKRAAKRKNRKGKGKDTTQAISSDIIDLTFDDSPDGSAPERTADDSEAGPSTPKRPWHLGQLEGVQGFQSIPRSILTGITRLSYSPQPESPATVEPKGSNAQEIDLLNLIRTSPVPTRPFVSESNAGPSESETPAKQPGGDDLLLPANVTVNISDGDSEDEANAPHDASMVGLHFLDDDNTKGVSRYFDPSEPTGAEADFLATADQSKICSYCKKPGHKAKSCPHTICPVCGAMDEHERRDCPVSLVCFGCGQRGHRQSNCPDPVLRHSRKRGCDRCGARDHPENSCPSLWRVYAYFSSDARIGQQKVKRQSSGWHKEAIGGDEDDQWCYNCAREGHLGDDCPQRRVSGARLYTPTAFSYAMSSRGPFYVAAPPHMSMSATALPKPTHKRWDDDDTPLPFTTPAFGGLQAGKKSRDKARKAMEADAVAGQGKDDEGDWFARRSNTGDNTRGRGGKSNGGVSGRNGRNRPESRQGGNSGQNGLPFGHAHLMQGQRGGQGKKGKQTGKGISFGKLSLPGSGPGQGPGQGNLDQPGGKKHQGLPPSVPPSARPGPSGKQTLGTPANGKQEEGTGGTSSGSGLGGGGKRNVSGKRRRGKTEQMERDWETEYSNSGLGGGSVVGWGKDLDREEKAKKRKRLTRNERRERTAGFGATSGTGTGKGPDQTAGQGAGQIQPPAPGGNAKSKPKPKSKTTGQKYTGGY